MLWERDSVSSRRATSRGIVAASIRRGQYPLWRSLRAFNTVLKLPVVLLLFPQVSSAVEGDGRMGQYQVSGVITIRGAEFNFAEKAFNFQVFVKHDQWLIKMVPFEYSTNRSRSIYSSLQAGTDGTNIYSLSVYNSEYDRETNQKTALQELKKIEAKMLDRGATAAELAPVQTYITLISKNLDANQATNRMSRNQAIGEIRPGPFPMLSTDNPLASLWLAYCSTKVFGLWGTNVAPAIFFQGDKQYPYAFVKASVIKSPSFPYLPQHIDFDNRVELVLNDGSPENLGNTTGVATDWLAMYTVNSFQDVGELSVPSKFLLSKFSLSAQSKQTNLNVEISARVNDVSDAVALSEFIPREPVVTAVTDFRYPKTHPSYGVRVFSKSNEWPTVYEVQNAKEFVSRTTTKRRSDNLPNPKRFTVLVCFTLSLIALSVLVWKNNKPQNNIKGIINESLKN